MSFYLKRSEPFPYTILNMSREKSIASMREPRTEILHKDPREVLGIVVKIGM